jgi:hypothetical protein
MAGAGRQGFTGRPWSVTGTVSQKRGMLNPWQLYDRSSAV